VSTELIKSPLFEIGGDMAAQGSWLSPRDPEHWGIRLIPDGYTFTDVDPNSGDGFFTINSTITMNDLDSAAPPMVKFGGTIKLEQNLNAFGSGFLFWSRPLMGNANGVVTQQGPFYSYAGQPTFQADGAAHTVALGADVLIQTAFQTINSGTMAVATLGIPYSQIWAGSFTVGAGVTVNSRQGIFVDAPINNGTLTDNYGLRVTTQTQGTNNYGIVIGDAGTNTLWVNDTNNSTDEAGGIVFGSSKDTNIYRSAANELTTDDSLVVGTDLTTQAARIKNVTRVTTTYTILTSDEEVFGNTDSAGFTVTLPAGVAGQHYRIVNTGSSGNNLTIAPNGSEHLLGANSNFTLVDGESLIITYNSTDGWM